MIEIICITYICFSEHKIDSIVFGKQENVVHENVLS